MQNGIKILSFIIEVTSTRDKEFSVYTNTGKQEVNIGAPGEFVLVANDVYFPTGERKPGEIIYHSQKWVLESLSNDTLDGKTLKYAYATSTLDNAKLIYVGNSQYVVQKDGKNLELERWKLHKVWKDKEEKVVEEYGNIDVNCTYAFKTPSYGNDNQKFVIRYYNGYYYI